MESSGLVANLADVAEGAGVDGGGLSVVGFEGFHEEAECFLCELSSSLLEEIPGVVVDLKNGIVSIHGRVAGGVVRGLRVEDGETWGGGQGFSMDI